MSKSSLDNTGLVRRLTTLKGSKSIKEFAAFLGSEYRIVAQYFSGDRRPGIDFLFALAERGVNVNWLLIGEGEMYVEKKEARVPAELQAYLKELEEEGVDVVQLVAEVRAFREFKRRLVDPSAGSGAQGKPAPAAAKKKEIKAEPNSSAQKKRK